VEAVMLAKQSNQSSAKETAMYTMQFRHLRNIWGRYGEIRLMQKHLRECERDAGPTAPLVSAYLRWWFSSVKSLLDAVALMLKDTYRLELRPAQCDLSTMRGGAFWKSFHGNARAKAYGKLRPWFNEVTVWRDAVDHRVSPLALMWTHPGEIRVVARPDVHISDVAGMNGPTPNDWVAPTTIPSEWEGHIHLLVDLACQDLTV